MNRRRHGLFAALLLAALPPAAAQAETVYKWVGKDGVVTYSQRPPAKSEARDLQALDVETLSPEQRRAARLLLQSEEQRADAAYRQMQDTLDEADEHIRSATDALRQAEAALETGRTPLPGERLGTVGGFSRLSQAYFDRVATLERAVAEAKRRLEQAYAARNSY